MRALRATVMKTLAHRARVATANDEPWLPT